MIFYFIALMIITLWKYTPNNHFFPHLSFLSLFILNLELVMPDTLPTASKAIMAMVLFIMVIRYFIDISPVRAQILDRRHKRKSIPMPPKVGAIFYFWIKYGDRITTFTGYAVIVSGLIYIGT